MSLCPRSRAARQMDSQRGAASSQDPHTDTRSGNWLRSLCILICSSRVLQKSGRIELLWHAILPVLSH